VRAVGAVFDIKTATGFQLNQFRGVFMEALKKKMERDRENRISMMIETGAGFRSGLGLKEGAIE
jgi:hypothetical protein